MIIQAIVSLADMMSCTTIAEGVENEMQEKFLSSVGCGIFQGFLYYRPQEVEQLNQLLSA